MSDSKWIRFDELAQAPHRHTRMWDVRTKAGVPLGVVRWYGGWRRYCFLPDELTVYEQDCLRDIANFCETRTRERKEALDARV